MPSGTKLNWTAATPKSCQERVHCPACHLYLDSGNTLQNIEQIEPRVATEGGKTKWMTRASEVVGVTPRAAHGVQTVQGSPAYTTSTDQRIKEKTVNKSSLYGTLVPFLRTGLSGWIPWFCSTTKTFEHRWGKGAWVDNTGGQCLAESGLAPLFTFDSFIYVKNMKQYT